MDYTFAPLLPTWGGPQEGMKFNVIKSKSGMLWLYGASGDDIFSDTGDGFEGGDITFQLANSSTDASMTLKGPSHASAESLFEDTEIDFRQRMLSFCVIGRRYILGYYPEFNHSSNLVVKDVIYQDDDWTFGNSNRYEQIAQDYADHHQLTVVMVKRVPGGEIIKWFTPPHLEKP